jgi:streptomycin 6-kinase
VTHFELPDAVVPKVRALGDVGATWLRELDGTVTELAREWRCELGAVMHGGTGGLVAEATLADGTPTVFKLAIPDGLDGHEAFAQELACLLAGDPSCYVSVYRHDATRRATLTERLGPTLESLAWSVEAQLDAITDTVALGWHEPRERARLRSGADKARWLEDFVMARWTALGRPCATAARDRAVECARRRAATAAAVGVLVHGDAHPANVLRAPNAPAGFKLIDPEGLVSEPAHDLGIVLRCFPDTLLAGDTTRLALAWCDRVARRARVDADAIWEWAFLESVSTGLFLLELGDSFGADFLAVADRLAAVAP